MAQPVRMGVTLPVPPDAAATLRQAEWAEAKGYSDVWFADTGELDALTLAAAVALRTKRVRIGVAVVPAYTRTPAVLASTASTLAQVSNGRFLLGLGASSHLMIEGWHGMKLEKPLTRVKETTLIIQQALKGEQTKFEGAMLRSSGYRLANPPKQHVPIVLAGLRPNMLEMAAEVSDGVVINLFPAKALPKILEHIKIGAARAGKKMEDLEVVCRHQIFVTDNPAAARDTIRKRFAPYFATPVYNRYLAWCGYEDAAKTIDQGWKEKDRAKTAGALSDEIINEVAIIGTAEQCQAKLRAMIAGGVTTPIVACPSPDPKEFAATHEAFTPKNFKV
ncbi:MAG TPA: LLM class flavin-dependent oxidoreductase [bacterium]